MNKDKYERAKRLKTLLQHKGVNKTHLAGYLEVNPATVSKWINLENPTDIKITHLPRLCDYLNVTMNFLVTGEKEPKSSKNRFIMQALNSFTPQLRANIMGIVTSLHTGNNLTN